jgi:hypothetical protein
MIRQPWFAVPFVPFVCLETFWEAYLTDHGIVGMMDGRNMKSIVLQSEVFLIEQGRPLLHVLRFLYARIDL